MAYMNQDKKKKIQAELKKVIPGDWKWSLAVRHSMSIVLTISQGPAELMTYSDGRVEVEDHRDINEYYIDQAFADRKLVALFKKINQALNLDNFDHSDPMTDYFHVGHYVDIKIGRWDRPFVAIECKPIEIETEPEEEETEPEEETADPIMAFVETLDFGDETEPAAEEPKKSTAVKPKLWLGKDPDWYCPID